MRIRPAVLVVALLGAAGLFASPAGAQTPPVTVTCAEATGENQAARCVAEWNSALYSSATIAVFASNGVAIGPESSVNDGEHDWQAAEGTGGRLTYRLVPLRGSALSGEVTWSVAEYESPIAPQVTNCRADEIEATSVRVRATLVDWSGGTVHVALTDVFNEHMLDIEGTPTASAYFLHAAPLQTGHTYDVDVWLVGSDGTSSDICEFHFATTTTDVPEETVTPAVTELDRLEDAVELLFIIAACASFAVLWLFVRAWRLR